MVAMLVTLACAAVPTRAAVQAAGAVADSGAARAPAPAAVTDSAATPAADSAATPAADSTRTATGETRADSTARAERLARLRARDVSSREPVKFFDQPRWVMARSFVIPGWGQLHNGSWLKAGAVATAEVWVGSLLLQDLRELDRLDAELAEATAAGDIARENELITAYNATLASSVGRQWLLAGVLAYALLDAYVDAHFKGFHLEFESDPALPGGAPPKGQRVSLRWDW
jgi:hypothetical protein